MNYDEIVEYILEIPKFTKKTRWKTRDDFSNLLDARVNRRK